MLEGILIKDLYWVLIWVLIGGHPFGYLDTPLRIPGHPAPDTGTLRNIQQYSMFI